MNTQLPIGQLLLQQGYLDANLIPNQLQQQNSWNQDLYFPTQQRNQGLIKPKRKQVKNACVHCQKACKKCDDGRPCQRCLKYNLADTCRNSIRKERQKGMKRGPYKTRPGERNKSISSGQTAPLEPNVISQTNNTQTTIFPMSVLPAFVTPNTSPNSTNKQDEPYTFDHHDLMMPFSFDNQNNATSLQRHFATTTTTSHGHHLDKQQQSFNDVFNYCTPETSPTSVPTLAPVATPTKFRFISQNSDFFM